jgi:hypothetical protein
MNAALLSSVIFSRAVGFAHDHDVFVPFAAPAVFHRKDADPDIPILIAAKSEYAKLKQFVVRSCDARVTQILPTLPKLTLLTVPA